MYWYGPTALLWLLSRWNTGYHNKMTFLQQYSISIFPFRKNNNVRWSCRSCVMLWPRCLYFQLEAVRRTIIDSEKGYQHLCRHHWWISFHPHSQNANQTPPKVRHDMSRFPLLPQMKNNVQVVKRSQGKRKTTSSCCHSSCGCGSSLLWRWGFFHCLYSLLRRCLFLLSWLCACFCHSSRFGLASHWSSFFCLGWGCLLNQVLVTAINWLKHPRGAGYILERQSFSCWLWALQLLRSSWERPFSLQWQLS